MDFDNLPDTNDMIGASKAAAAVLPVIAQVFPGWTMRSIGKAESKRTDRILSDLKKIAENKDSLGLDDDSIGYLMSDVVQRHNRCNNFDHVLRLASPMVKDDADGSKVSMEWAEHFRDHAEKATDEEVRATWAKILASEINKPGSFSKRTLTILSDMEKADADALMRLCAMCILPASGTTVTLNPILLLDEDECGTSFNSGRFDYGMRSSLESLGLIDSSVTSLLELGPAERAEYITGKSVYRIENPTKIKVTLSFSPVLTKYGRELSTLFLPQHMDDVGEILRRKAEIAGLACERYKVVPATAFS